MRRGGDAGVTFCWPGVGAVLISLWFFLFPVLDLLALPAGDLSAADPCSRRSVPFVPRSFRAVAGRAGLSVDEPC